MELSTTATSCWPLQWPISAIVRSANMRTGTNSGFAYGSAVTSVGFPRLWTACVNGWCLDQSIFISTADRLRFANNLHQPAVCVCWIPKSVLLSIFFAWSQLSSIYICSPFWPTRDHSTDSEAIFSGQPLGDSGKCAWGLRLSRLSSVSNIASLTMRTILGIWWSVHSSRRSSKISTNL